MGDEERVADGTAAAWGAIHEAEDYLDAHRAPTGDPLGTVAWYVRYLIARCGVTEPLPELGWARDLRLIQQAADAALAERDAALARVAALEAALVEERAKAFCWGAWELQEDEDLDEWRAEARAELAAEGLLLPTTEEER